MPAINKDKILVIGASGQIGVELTMALRSIYGNSNVVASDLREENEGRPERQQIEIDAEHHFHSPGERPARRADGILERTGPARRRGRDRHSREDDEDRAGQPRDRSPLRREERTAWKEQ